MLHFFPKSEETNLKKNDRDQVGTGRDVMLSGVVFGVGQS